MARSLIERGRAAEVVRMLSDPPATTPEELAVLAIACSRSGDNVGASAIVKDLTARDPQPLARWRGGMPRPATSMARSRHSNR